MNIVFVIDTSLSMIQSFDKKLSFIEAAKSAVERFITIRESNRKVDKYFLVSTSLEKHQQHINVPFKTTKINSSWEHPLQHLIFQLRILRPCFEQSNVPDAVFTSIALLNKFNQVSCDKVIFGNLCSLLEPSAVIVFTDGGIQTYNGELLDKSANLSIQREFNPRYNIYGSNISSFEQSVYSVIMTKHNTDGYYSCKKLSLLIGGDVYQVSKYDELMIQMEEISYSLSFGKVNVCLETYNKEVDNIEKHQNIKSLFPYKSSLNSNTNNNNINNNSVNFSNKYLVPLNIEQIKQRNNVYNSCRKNTDIFNIEYKEKWPLPYQFILNKLMTNLPYKKKSHPHYVIGRLVKHSLINNHKDLFEEYEILDNNFALSFFSNYPDLLITEQRKIHWDIYSLNENYNYQNKSNYITKPFGCLKILVSSNHINKFNSTIDSFNSINNTQNAPSMHEYLLKNPNTLRLKLCCFGYNMYELIDIIDNLKTRSYSENLVSINNYLLNAPFYYVYYLRNLLNIKQLFKIEDNTVYSLEEKFINVQLLKFINNTYVFQNSKLKEMIKMLDTDRQIHRDFKSKCCGLNVFKNFRGKKNLGSIKNSSINGLKKEAANIKVNNLSISISNFLRVKLKQTNLEGSSSGDIEIAIELMGNFKDRVMYFNSIAMRDPYNFDNRDKENSNVYFGNPFHKNKSKYDNIDDIDFINMNNVTDNSVNKQLFSSLKNKEEKISNIIVENTLSSHNSDDDKLLDSKNIEGLKDIHPINKKKFFNDYSFDNNYGTNTIKGTFPNNLESTKNSKIYDGDNNYNNYNNSNVSDYNKSTMRTKRSNSSSVYSSLSKEQKKTDYKKSYNPSNYDVNFELNLNENNINNDIQNKDCNKSKKEDNKNKTLKETDKIKITKENICNRYEELYIKEKEKALNAFKSLTDYNNTTLEDSLTVTSKYNLRVEKLMKWKILQDLSEFTRLLYNSKNNIIKFNYILDELSEHSIFKLSTQKISYLNSLHNNLQKTGCIGKVLTILENFIKKVEVL